MEGSSANFTGFRYCIVNVQPNVLCRHAITFLPMHIICENRNTKLHIISDSMSPLYSTLYMLQCWCRKTHELVMKSYKETIQTSYHSQLELLNYCYCVSNALIKFWCVLEIVESVIAIVFCNSREKTIMRLIRLKISLIVPEHTEV